MWLYSSRFKDVQSGAYAPPKRLYTRPPPITRDTYLPLSTAHALTRVGEANPPRRGAQPPHSQDGDEDHHCGELPPSHPQHTPRPPPSCTAAVRKRSRTRRHARGSSRDRGTEALLQEIFTATRGMVNMWAGTLVVGAWITTTRLGSPELRPELRVTRHDAAPGSHHSSIASIGRKAWPRAG